MLLESASNPPGTVVVPPPKLVVVVPLICALLKLAPSATLPRHSSVHRPALPFAGKADIDPVKIAGGVEGVDVAEGAEAEVQCDGDRQFVGRAQIAIADQRADALFAQHPYSCR